MLSELLKTSPETLVLVALVSLVALVAKLVSMVVSSRRKPDHRHRDDSSRESTAVTREELIRVTGRLEAVMARQDRASHDVEKARTRMDEMRKALADAQANIESLR